MTDLEAAPSVERGRQAALVVAGIFVGLELSVMVSYLGYIGSEKLVQHCVRLLLAALLSYALYRGHTWSRWLMLLLVAVAVWNAAPFAGAVWRSGRHVGGGTLWAMVILYIIAGRIFLYSKHLRAYMKAVRPPSSQAAV